MRLVRINKLKNFRAFHDFTWPNDLHSFGQFNVFYGWNGAGKSTLAALFRHLETRKPLLEGEAKLEFTGNLQVLGNQFAEEVGLPAVRVFDRGFIETAISNTQNKFGHIFYVGEESIGKRDQVERLKSALEECKADLVKKQMAKQDAARAFDKFCVDRAKKIKELMSSYGSTSHGNYTKAKFGAVAAGWNAASAIEARLNPEDKAKFRTQAIQKSQAPLSLCVVDSINMETFARKVETILKRNVVSTVINELVTDTSVAQWVHRGLQLHEGAHDVSSCRFCTQPFTQARRTELAGHFNDAFAQYHAQLNVVLNEVMSAESSLERVVLHDPARFYDVLQTRAHEIASSIGECIADIRGQLSILKGALEAKRSNAFLDATLPALDLDIGRRLLESVADFNNLIREHMTTTTNFRSGVEDAWRVLELAAITEEYVEFKDLEQNASATALLVHQTASQLLPITLEITSLEKEIVEFRKPAAELNADLQAYLGRDELKFNVEGTGYRLSRSGQPVTNLSEGERTAIAFLYFLKSLEDKNFDLNTGIVVIDDPVSSLDANALFSAFAYTKEKTKNSGQLFILTHSFEFFRQVKNWFHHLKDQQKKDIKLRPARFYLVRAAPIESGGKRLSSIVALDPLLEKYESEYHYLFKCVYEVATNDIIIPGLSLETHYGMPNIARRLLESFLAFRYPSLAGELRATLEKASFDAVKKTQILRFVHTYSHADRIADPQHDPYILISAPQILSDILSLMHAEDATHYDNMVALVKTSTTHPLGAPK